MRGWFSRDYEPVATVEPGGSVSFQVPNAGWFWDADVEPDRPEGAGHALYGPVEVLDLRSLRPLDEDALLASAAKTGRVVVVQEAPRTAGFGAEIAAILAEKAILDLHGPVLRVTGFDVPYPYWKIEDRYMPSVERVVGAARKLLEF